MNRRIVAAAFALLFGLATCAGALTIENGATDVGSVDKLVASCSLPNSSPATELNWINSVLGAKFTTEILPPSLEWTETDQNSHVWAARLLNDPGYYLIKTGNVSTGGARDFLFYNSGNTDYAVVDLYSQTDGLGFKSHVSITGISHITTTGQAPQPVPEPGSLALVGIGMAGMLIYNRRPRKQQ